MTIINNKTNLVFATDQKITKQQFNTIIRDPNHSYYRKAVMLCQDGETIYYIKP